MVSFKSLAVAALAAAPTAMAYITNMTAPATAAAGTKITATFQTAIYSQNWHDFGIVFGLAEQKNFAPPAVGTEIQWTPLTGQEGLEFPYTFTVDVTIPENLVGDYLFVTSIPYLVGASGSLNFTSFNTPITISAA